MNALSDLLRLPVADRLELIESLCNSIAEDQDSVSDPPEVVAQLRERKAKFNPSSGVPWTEARNQIRRPRD